MHLKIADFEKHSNLYVGSLLTLVLLFRSHLMALSKDTIDDADQTRLLVLSQEQVKR